MFSEQCGGGIHHPLLGVVLIHWLWYTLYHDVVVVTGVAVWVINQGA